MSKLLFAAVAMVGCFPTNTRVVYEDHFEDRVNAELGALRSEHPSMDKVLNDAYAFAVFPHIGEGQIGTGEAIGHGVLYVHGAPIGFVSLHQTPTGVNLISRSYTEVLVLRDQVH